MHGTGMDYPVYDDLKKFVYDAGKSSGAGDQVGSVLCFRGMYAAPVISEAIRKAQEPAGTPQAALLQQWDATAKKGASSPASSPRMTRC